MPGVNSSNFDESRLRNQRAQIEQKNEIETRELQSQHDVSLTRMLDQHAFLLENLRRAYDVQISKEAQNLDERLTATRAQHEEKINEVKRAGESEVIKIQNQSQKRIDDATKSGESKLEETRKHFQSASDVVQAQYKKHARLNKQEVSS